MSTVYKQKKLQKNVKAMTSSFRKTFFPSKEERIRYLEMVIEMHNKEIGHCCTCVFHIPTDMPGVVEDHGSCRVNSPIFTEKVCGFRNVNCSSYAEDADHVERIRGMLKDLKGCGKDA